jgi:Papain-like cysteine protease AvrRpt2
VISARTTLLKRGTLRKRAKKKVPSAKTLYGDEVMYPPLPKGKTLETLGAARALPQPPRAEVNLDVPFVHQLWDTPDTLNGNWACGPACMTMVLAYYGLLEPLPITVSSPRPHTSQYGWYLSNVFAHHGHTFSATAQAPNGRFAGLYGAALDNHPGAGWCTSPYKNANGKGLEVISKVFGLPMSIVVTPKRPNSRYLERPPTEAAFKTALGAGSPLIVSGFFRKKFDHLIVVRGYYHDGAELKWIVNDPYGFETDKSFDGHNVVYNFDEINPKWFCSFKTVQGVRSLPSRTLQKAVAPRSPFSSLLDAALNLVFDFLRSKFIGGIPGAALELAQPIIADVLADLTTGSAVRLTAETRLKIQARLDDTLRQAGLVGGS